MNKDTPVRPGEKFIHRDLSWLAFNERVLDEANDKTNPVLERVKFLAICAGNLDEFLMVRVAGMRRLIDSGFNRKDIFGYYMQDLYAASRERYGKLLMRLYKTWQEQIAAELEAQKVHVLKAHQLSPAQKKSVKRYFDTTLYPIITPLAVDQSHPFPVLHSKTNVFAVYLDRGGDHHQLALIMIPQSVPRLFRLPAEKDALNCILIDDIIRENLGTFFKGYTIEASFIFRVIRDSALDVKEEYTPDLLKAIEREIQKRPMAKVASLQVEKKHHPRLLELIYTGLAFTKDEITVIDGDLDLTCLFGLTSMVTGPELAYHSFVPSKMEYDSIFDRIGEGDFIVHMPYQSFQPTVDLIQTAAKDAGVLAIKMTLYRTNEDSAIIRGLIEAAKNGKQVTVLVEIKARFDEEKNIDWTRELEAAGCHVVYGIPGMKVHSKAALIVRREDGRIRRYVHLSTGNYNERTAKLYTDIGYFTVNEDVATDISDLFNVITGYSLPSRWRRIVAAPFDMRNYFYELIDKEIEHQRSHKNGFIFAKMNSLEDVQMIEKLYQASNEGVRIQLLVRGICCLIPGVKGMSENIWVKSIVGRFLEHSRIYYFNNNGEPRTFLASADWMQRNLDRRIELLFEIRRDDLKEELKNILDTYWKDAAKTRTLTANGTYSKPKNVDDKTFNAQEYFIDHYTR